MPAPFEEGGQYWLLGALPLLPPLPGTPPVAANTPPVPPTTKPNATRMLTKRDFIKVPSIRREADRGPCIIALVLIRSSSRGLA